MLRSSIAGIVIALVAAGPAAAGGTLKPLDAHLVAGVQRLAGPSFAGDGIAWATQSDFKGGYDVSVLRGGTLVTQHLDTFSTGVETSEAFAASPDTVALAVNARGCDDPTCRAGGTHSIGSTVYAGPIGQPLTYQRCGSGDLPESVDLEGTVIAYLDHCAGGVTVRDIAAPDEPWRQFAAYGGVRIAGPYVAVGLSSGLTVYDWRSGEKVYSHDKTLAAAAFDLREDGTVVFSARGSELDWASPQEPTPHRIAEPGAIADVRIAGSRVAVRVGDQFRVFDIGGNEIGATPAPDAIGGFDFDGQRLIFGVQPCEVTAIVTWDLAGDAPALPPGLCPAARLAGGTGVVDLGKRRLTVPVRCPTAPPLGCSGEWYANFHPSRSSFYTAFVALGPGERRNVRFRLVPSQTCSFAKGHVRSITVELGPSSTRRMGPPRSRHHAKLSGFRVTGRARGCAR